MTRIPTRLIDALGAAVLVAAGLTQMLATATANQAASALLVIGALAPIAILRSSPLLAFAASAAGTSAIAAVPGSGEQIAIPIGLLIATFVLGRLELRERGIAAMGALLVTIVVMLVVTGAPASDLAFTTLIYGGAFGAGRALGVRDRHVEDARHAATRQRMLDELERTHALQTERTRIARELHDIVAHSISVVVLQAQAVRTTLDVERSTAHDGIDAIERAGRDALAEMRGLLGVLRADSSGPPLEPQPGIDQVADLVAAARGSGMEVSFDARGTERDLGSGRSLAAYRALQEALTNCRRHAPGAAVKVVLDWGDDALELVVRNDRPPRSAPRTTGPVGHGLIGMRERFELYGGQILHGPTSIGGFELRAALPLPVALPIGSAPA
ncbi:MAG: sensor histidine kinase [Thermoleophilia bacterium]|nr:sensor histidine kinase [Thermoleophilia bacterium]